MQSSTVAQQAPARNLNRGWWPMLPEWSRRVLKPVLNTSFGEDSLRHKERLESI
jgi:hypothetical protein